MTTVDDAVFRAALGRFASGVTVVTTQADGVLHAMTASAFTSVSLTPPQVLICVHDVNRFHGAALASGRWGVSILTEEGEPDATHFARKGRDLLTQFDEVPHHRGPAGQVLLDRAHAWLECRTVVAHPGGDHTILIGAVESARVDERRDDPLLYYRSRYGTLVRLDRGEKEAS